MSTTDTISISQHHGDQIQAAECLSNHLNHLGFHHAYIGGFAWALLGSDRPTQDIDILIEIDQDKILALRERVSDLDIHFARLGFKFFFITDPISDFKGEELVRKSKNNVLVETLPTGSLGLPKIAEPRCRIPGDPECILEILHPSVLILTKMKRWAVNYTSTRPKTVHKNGSDKRDIDFIIHWLAESSMYIGFDMYHGKTKPELLKMVRQYHDKFMDDIPLMEKLKSVMLPVDWTEMLEQIPD